MIAQEVWYDAPELRHLVKPGHDAEPAEFIPTSEDPQIDPEYSSWGTDAASLDYIGLIPFLIRAIQEQQHQIQEQQQLIQALGERVSDLESDQGTEPDL